MNLVSERGVNGRAERTAKSLERCQDVAFYGDAGRKLYNLGRTDQ